MGSHAFGYAPESMARRWNSWERSFCLACLQVSRTSAVLYDWRSRTRVRDSRVHLSWAWSVACPLGPRCEVVRCPNQSPPCVWALRALHLRKCGASCPAATPLFWMIFKPSGSYAFSSAAATLRTACMMAVASPSVRSKSVGACLREAYVDLAQLKLSPVALWSASAQSPLLCLYPRAQRLLDTESMERHPAPVACPAARRLDRLVHQWAIDNLLIHMAGVLSGPYLVYLYEELAG